MPYSPPYRTTVDLVMSVLLSDYDTVNNPDLTPFIQAASSMVDTVVKRAIYKQQWNRNLQSPNSGQAELIERYLAAHFYTISDRQYKSKSTAGASASFAPNFGEGLDSSSFGMMAVRVDPSNCLQNIDKFQYASLVHIGTNWGGILRPGLGDITTLPFIGSSEME